MINWFKKNKKGIIRGTFLIPIVLVMIISISHVVSWYDLSNPFSWAIYLSFAIEIAAMSSISAASVRIKGGVWFIFVLVTLIQFIGNIFFCYKDTDINSQEFKDWVELSSPIFEMLGSNISNLVSQRRWLALLQGGLLPMISLASLHFFIKYGGTDDEPKKEVVEPIVEEVSTTPLEVKNEPVINIEKTIEEPKEEVIEPITEEIPVQPLQAKIETDNNGNFRFY